MESLWPRGEASPCTTCSTRHTAAPLPCVSPGQQKVPHAGTSAGLSPAPKIVRLHAGSSIRSVSLRVRRLPRLELIDAPPSVQYFLPFPFLFPFPFLDGLFPSFADMTLPDIVFLLAFRTLQPWKRVLCRGTL